MYPTWALIVADGINVGVAVSCSVDELAKVIDGVGARKIVVAKAAVELGVGLRVFVADIGVIKLFAGVELHPTMNRQREQAITNFFMPTLKKRGRGYPRPLFY